MEDIKVKVADRELTMVFDVAAWCDVERTFGSLERMYQRLDKDVLPTCTGLQLAAIVATSGTCDRAKKEAVSYEWLMQHLKPVDVGGVIEAARKAVLRGMHMDESLFDEADAVDVGLMEDAKKKTADE